MINIVLERINSQKVKTTPRVKFNQFIKPIKKELSNPIKQEKLKSLLMEELQNKEIIQKPVEEKKEIIFDNIISFCNWYIPNRLKFNEFQQKAIDTVVVAREMIEKGCGCQRHNRTNRAEEYFKNFWEQNSKTDMVKKLCDVLEVKNVKILSRGTLVVDFTL